MRFSWGNFDRCVMCGGKKQGFLHKPLLFVFFGCKSQPKGQFLDFFHGSYINTMPLIMRKPMSFSWGSYGTYVLCGGEKQGFLQKLLLFPFFSCKSLPNGQFLDFGHGSYINRMLLIMKKPMSFSWGNFDTCVLRGGEKQ